MGRPRLVKRRYGLPWAGYQSSAPPHMCSPDKATSDGPSSSRRSVNFRYAPVEGKFYRREGTAAKGSATGILENGTGELTVGRCRQMVSVKSPSLTDGYPTHGSLWTEEGNNKGCFHFFNSNDSTDHVIGQEFGTTQYPTALGSPSFMKALPYIRTTDNTIGRFNTLALRALHCPGSRKVVEASDKVLFGSLNGVPTHWDKRFNENNADTGDSWHVWHTGHPPPLGAMSVAVGTTNPTGSWAEGDIFYISCAYKFADGSVSMPIIPRDRNDDINYNAATNMSGWHKVTLARSGGLTNKYLFLTWSGIPIGPKDCVGRFLLRTPRNPGKSGATGNDATDPAPLDLRITAYIANNTDTTYIDPNGNDLSLVTDPLIVRFDHIMQPPARYMGAMDGRVLAAYTKPSPVAIYLAPHVNAGESDTLLDNIKYEYTLNGGTLTLYKDANTTTLTNIGDDSIQTLVDRINNTVVDPAPPSTGGKWIACVAPGADAGASCDAALLATANTNLVSITGATDYSGDTAGRIRSYASSYYAPIFFSNTYLANFPTAKGRVFFTAGGPGMPTMAANSWVAANYRTGQDSWGEVIGSGSLRGGAVVCYSKAIATLENRRGGSSGVDEDYRLYELNAARGCISAASIIEINGVVGYLTRDGYVITDGKEEVVISGDVWNPATQTGEWAYEIGQCSEAVASDTDIARFSATVMGGRLYVSYMLTGSARSAATDGHPTHWLVYDFTGSIQYSGLRGMLRPDGQPWGWSTPQQSTISGLGPMVEVVTASGVTRYVSAEDSSGLTSNGLTYNVETGALDGATAVTGNLWSARDFVDQLKRKSAQELMLFYKKAGTGLQLSISRDGLGVTADSTAILPTTGSNNFTRLTTTLAQSARSPSDTIEFLVYDTSGSGQTAQSDVWGFEADVLLLDSYS